MNALAEKERLAAEIVNDPRRAAIVARYQRISSPTAARAVAQACATNKLAAAIPCHRVVRNNGSLVDYRWGGSASVRCPLVLIICAPVYLA